MPLNPQAAAYAVAAIFGLKALLIGLVNNQVPAFGDSLLNALASVYPGYQHDRSVGSVVILTGYMMFDGAIKGWLFAWFYNQAAKSLKR